MADKKTEKRLNALELSVKALDESLDALSLDVYGAPNQCGHDWTTAEVILPKGKGAIIKANRVRDEVSYFWVRYKRGRGPWLYDGPPFTSVDPRGGMTYKARTAGAFNAVPGGRLRIRIEARWAVRPNWDMCFPRVKKVRAKDRTSLQFFTGTNEPYNLSVDVIYK